MERAFDCKKSARNIEDPGSTPWVGKISWRREWQPTPVFLPGESHGQRRLVGYSPWGRKESDMTEELTLSLFFPTSGGNHFIMYINIKLLCCLLETNTILYVHYNSIKNKE